ncbi:MAG: FAD-dependent oxidoreductase [Pseudomonadota bacterium]
MKRIIVFLSIIVAIILLLAIFDIGEFLTLSELKAHKDQLQSLVNENRVISGFLFFLGYVIATSISIPGALIFTLSAGALFGLVTGTIIVSFASSIGAFLAFIIARFFLHDFVQNKYADRLKNINDRVEKEGAYYLLFLRLVPAFPFVLVNLTMALTSIRPLTYYWVSQLGMFPATVVYVNAGTQLASIESPEDILSPSVLLAFILLGILPLLTKHFVNMLHKNRVYKGYNKPKHFEYNTVVIGGGSAGLVAAYTTSTLQGKVALIEQAKMGGDCLNTGCVPSKSILRSAKFVRDIEHYKDFGLTDAEFYFDFKNIIDRVRQKISIIEPKDSVERYTELGVECKQGEAILKSPWEVEVNGKTLSTKNIIIATGGEPAVLHIEGINDVPYYTTDNVWAINELPQKLLIIGAGVIGCELGQAFARLGADVHIVNNTSSVLAKEDREAASLVEKSLIKDGINLYHEYKIHSLEQQGDSYLMKGVQRDKSIDIDFSHLLIAIGRKPNLQGVDTLDLETDDRGRLSINEYLQTNYPNIYACGDVASATQYTHSASHQAWYAAFNALFHPIKKFKCKMDNIPRAVFTDPEITGIGISEEQAIAQNIPYDSTTFSMDEIDRAITDNATEGFIKVITPKNSDKILGVCIVGEHASELIAEFVLAKTHGLGLNKILQTIHIYPTRSEINRMVAGKWRRSRLTENTVNLLKKYQSWRLGG